MKVIFLKLIKKPWNHQCPLIYHPPKQNKSRPCRWGWRNIGSQDRSEGDPKMEPTTAGNFPRAQMATREFRWEPGKRLAENGTFVVTRLGKLKEMGVFLRLFSNCRDVLGCKWGVSPWEQVHEMSLVPSEMIGKSCKGPRRGEIEIPNFWPHQTGWTCRCWNWQDVQ